MLRSLVGSEMCIRDSHRTLCVIRRTLYSFRRVLWFIHRMLYLFHRTLYSAYRTLYFIHRTLYFDCRCLYFIRSYPLFLYCSAPPHCLNRGFNGFNGLRGLNRSAFVSGEICEIRLICLIVFLNPDEVGSSDIFYFIKIARLVIV